MTDESFQVMLAVGVFNIPLVIIIIIRDYTHTKALNGLYDKIDKYRDKMYR